MPAVAIGSKNASELASIWDNGRTEVVIGRYSAASDVLMDEINTWLENSESTKGLFDWFFKSSPSDERFLNIVYELTDENTAFLMKLKYAKGS